MMLLPQVHVVQPSLVGQGQGLQVAQFVMGVLQQPGALGFAEELALACR